MLQWKLVTDRYLSNKVLQKCLTSTFFFNDGMKCVIMWSKLCKYSKIEVIENIVKEYI